ncbi:unnamed protein product [Arabidopsis thaliana]|uniref:Uncharacterized protein n=1 Tax=Arabidopsis thaliana TaxID=3702 RepID=A0A654EJB4_ARATH|nr:unnamed protein product [Arabidopsis thaliana]
MKARSSKGGLVAILALVVYCFFENMDGNSIDVPSYEPVGSYSTGCFFALENKDKMLKSFPSYNEYLKRFNLASVYAVQIFNINRNSNQSLVDFSNYFLGNIDSISLVHGQ